jgi:5-formyltetrahydrofolate cyclo-ligase
MKTNIRKEMLSKRNALSEKQARQWSLMIKTNLYSLPEFASAKKYMIYVSKGNEVYTQDLIEENIKRKRTSVPAVTKDGIKPSLINFFDELKVGAYGILEPKKITEVNREELELVVVPGVAFDVHGNRVGYGKGFFDGFLRWVNCPKIGLAYEMQLVDKIPKEKQDVPMDIIITEKRIIRIRKIKKIKK